MVKHVLIGLIFLCTVHTIVAQDSVVVVIQLLDSKSADPIQNVVGTFEANGEKWSRESHTKGQITLMSPKGITIAASFEHDSYDPVSKDLKIGKGYADDSIFFEVKMEFVQLLEPTVVTAPGIPQVVYKSSRLHVQDFEVLADGRLVLLTYSKRLNKGSELLLYDGEKVINTFDVPGVATHLLRDYRGNAHVVCEENVFGIHVTGNKIAISSLEKEYFVKYVAPIVDTNVTKLYFSTFNPDYPAFEYFAYDQLDSTYLKIIGIEDELMMELYRAEYKWMDVRTKLWAKNKEIQTGIDAEVWVGANYFTQSIYYKELYAPLFHRNDSLLVFDYYKDKLFTFSANGKKLDSVGIYHHYQPKQTGWKKQLIQDRITGEIYAIYDRAGYAYIGWVDTKTGEINEYVRLEKRYADKIEINGNFVYYVYREFESIDKKHLWKQRLPYNFGEGTVDLPTEDEAELNQN